MDGRRPRTTTIKSSNSRLSFEDKWPAAFLLFPRNSTARYIRDSSGRVKEIYVQPRPCSQTFMWSSNAVIYAYARIPPFLSGNWKTCSRKPTFITSRRKEGFDRAPTYDRSPANTGHNPTLNEFSCHRYRSFKGSNNKRYFKMHINLQLPSATSLNTSLEKEPSAFETKQVNMTRRETI